MSNRRPPSPLRNGFTADDDSEDGSENEEDWENPQHSPSPSIQKFASNFAQRVNTLVGSVGSSTRSLQGCADGGTSATGLLRAGMRPAIPLTSRMARSLDSSRLPAHRVRIVVFSAERCSFSVLRTSASVHVFYRAIPSDLPIEQSKRISRLAQPCRRSLRAPHQEKQIGFSTS